MRKDTLEERVAVIGLGYVGLPVALAFARRFPDTVRQIQIDAERLHAGEFDLLGYRGLRFGNPIDWHLDPVHNRRSPLLQSRPGLWQRLPSVCCWAA